MKKNNFLKKLSFKIRFNFLLCVFTQAKDTYVPSLVHSTCAYKNGHIVTFYDLPTTGMQYRGNTSSRFSSNSIADASELLENLEEIIPRYCMDYDFISIFC